MYEQGTPVLQQGSGQQPAIPTMPCSHESINIVLRQFRLVPLLGVNCCNSSSPDTWCTMLHHCKHLMTPALHPLACLYQLSMECVRQQAVLLLGHQTVSVPANQLALPGHVYTGRDPNSAIKFNTRDGPSSMCSHMLLSPFNSIHEHAEQQWGHTIALLHPKIAAQLWQRVTAASAFTGQNGYHKSVTWSNICSMA